MTFIEMLQQGGYILPQYSSGQQSYQAPNVGMQTLQTMMAIDQGAQQRYNQGEQLNLARSQNTQNIINSTIQNEMSRKTQDRLQKQMDLSNQKLEFDMQKAILKDIDEERAKLNSTFLLRDRLQIEKDLAEQGLDEAGILEGMKGDLSFDNYSKFQLKRQSVLSKQKNGFTNMQTYNQAAKLVEKTDTELKRAHELMKVGALDYNAYEQYLQNSKDAAAELIKFESGDVQNIDFKDSKWSGITGATDFLDEVQAKYQTETANKLSNQKLSNALLQEEATKQNLEQDKALQPILRVQKSLAALGDITKNFGLINGLRQLGIKDPTNLQEVTAALMNMSPEQAQTITDLIETERLKQEQAKGDGKPNSLDEALAWQVNSGELSIEEALALKNTKDSTVTYVTDSAGRKGVTDSKGVTNYGGYRTDDKGWVDGTYGGRIIEAKYIKKDIENNSIQPQKDGSLKIKGNTKVMKMFGIEASWMSYDETDIQTALPGAKKEGEYWIIPPDDIAPPTTPTSTNNDIIIPKVNSSTGTTTVPANASSVL